MKRHARMGLVALALGIMLMLSGCLGDPGEELVGKWSGIWSGRMVVFEILPSPYVKDALVAKGYGYQASVKIFPGEIEAGLPLMTYNFNATPAQYEEAIHAIVNAMFKDEEYTLPDYPIFIWGAAGGFGSVLWNKVGLYHPGDGIQLPFGGTGEFETGSGFTICFNNEEEAVVLSPAQ